MGHVKLWTPLICGVANPSYEKYIRVYIHTYVYVYVYVFVYVYVYIGGPSRLRCYTVYISGIYRHLLHKANSPILPSRDRIGDLGNSLFASNPTKLENGFVLTTCGSWCRARKLRHTTVHTYHETLASLKYLWSEFIRWPGASLGAQCRRNDHTRRRRAVSQSPPTCQVVKVLCTLSKGDFCATIDCRVL